MAKHFRRNESIRSKTVRLIDENDEQAGIVAIEKALQMAKEQELDLVEVAPTANPPVCKIMDYGKHVYRVKKQDQKQRKSQKQSEVKGIRLSIRTGDHDIETKIKKAKEFLSDNHVVKVALILRGREFTHIDMAREKVQRFAEALKDISKVEQEPKKQGANIFMILAPRRGETPVVGLASSKEGPAKPGVASVK